MLAKLQEALRPGARRWLGALARGEGHHRQFFLLSDKPTIFACNVRDTDGHRRRQRRPAGARLRQTHLSCEAVVISAQIEELIDLSPEEGDAFSGSSVSARQRRLAHRATTCWDSDLAAGGKCGRERFTSATAPKAAGVGPTSSAASSRRGGGLHDDQSLRRSIAAAQGLYRMEGKGKSSGTAT